MDARSRRRFQERLDWYADAKLVSSVLATDLAVTDRIHVVVTAVITGTEMLYIDPYDQRISRYLSFTFRDGADRLVRQVPREWLQAHAYVLAMAS